ncbi:MAG: hypothetical protein ACKVS8_11725 [Phycisphaerales bacterium]
MRTFVVESRGVAGLAIGAMLAASGTALAGVSVSGTAVKNGMLCSATWTYDTGASETLLSRACATMMGLLDGTGMPAAGTPMKNFNSGEVETWCFDTVALASTDNFGNVCVASTTMYVSKNADSWGSTNLLGRDWRKKVKGQWDDETETVRWPKAAAAPAKPAVPKTDNDGGIKRVYEDIRFFNGPNTTFLDMTYMTGSPFSFMPLQTAIELGATPIGTVDLFNAFPDVYTRLAIAEQNLSRQTSFQLVEVQGFDFGLGPIGGTRQFLVSNDQNSQFGIMGNDFFQTPGSTDFGYIHQEDFDDLGNDAILFGAVPAPGVSALACVAGVVAARRRRP